MRGVRGNGRGGEANGNFSPSIDYLPHAGMFIWEENCLKKKKKERKSKTRDAHKETGRRKRKRMTTGTWWRSRKMLLPVTFVTYQILTGLGLSFRAKSSHVTTYPRSYYQRKESRFWDSAILKFSLCYIIKFTWQSYYESAWGMRIKLRVFFISNLGGIEWRASGSDIFDSVKSPSFTNSIEKWEGHNFILNVKIITLSFPGIEPIHPIAIYFSVSVTRDPYRLLIYKNVLWNWMHS